MILFTIIGSIIGAGFASGQEIYLFFYRFGIKAYATVSMKTDNTVSTSNCEYPLFVYCEETKCDDGEMRLNTLRNNI